MKTGQRLPSIPQLLWTALLVAVCVITAWLGSHPTSTSGFRPGLRVVSLTPNVTEMIFDLGAEKSLVGISDYCVIPGSASTNSAPPQALPRCGGLLDPNFERILALRPSLIFVLGRMDRIQQFARQNRIRTESVHVDSFADLLRELRKVGTLLDKTPAAEQLGRSLEQRLAKVRTASAAFPRYRALILIGRERGSLKALMTVSGASYIGEMLQAAGGDNIFKDNQQPYFTASFESVLALRPEVIFELRAEDRLSQAEMRQARDDWSAAASTASLPAVRRGRIVVTTNDFATVPGPKMVDLAEFFHAHLRQFAVNDREDRHP